MNQERTPVRFHLAVFLVGAGLLTAAQWYWLSVPVRWAWLAAGNLVAYCIWAFDKRQARKGKRRVPEWTLHLMAFLGATPASLVAMHTLRHKTQKRLFTWGYSVLLCLQIFGALLYLRPPSAG